MMRHIAIGQTPRMWQLAASSPATGGYRGNGRKANLLERSYEY
jgi:hypothetical protein